MTLTVAASPKRSLTNPRAAGTATPTLLLAPALVRERQAELSAALPGVDLFYAVKANPHPLVLGELLGCGTSFDIASPAEAASALAVGATADALLCSNPVQSRKAIAEEYAAGVRTFVIDSVDEADKIADVAPGSAVLVRLGTSGAGSDWPLSGKFGTSPEDAVEILDRCPGLGLEPAGVAFHVGSQQREPGRWSDPIHQAAWVFRALRARGRRPRLLDIGGGFPAHHRDACPPLAEYGRAIERALASAFGRERPRILAEPGRSLVADAGVLVASVLGVSHRGGKRWVYLDAGVYHGLAETVGEAIHFHLETTADGGPTAPVVLAGPTCDSTDVMYTEVALPLSLAEGDLVHFHAAGAYTTCYATPFNGFAPLSTTIVDDLG